MGLVAISTDLLGCHTWERKVLLASSGWRLGMLWNILQWMGQSPTTMNYPALNVNNAKGEKSSLRLIGTHQPDSSPNRYIHPIQNRVSRLTHAILEYRINVMCLQTIFSNLFTQMTGTQCSLFMRSILERRPGWVRHEDTQQPLNRCYYKWSPWRRTQRRAWKMAPESSN